MNSYVGFYLIHLSRQSLWKGFLNFFNTSPKSMSDLLQHSCQRWLYLFSACSYFHVGQASRQTQFLFWFVDSKILSSLEKEQLSYKFWIIHIPPFLPGSRFSCVYQKLLQACWSFYFLDWYDPPSYGQKFPFKKKLKKCSWVLWKIISHPSEIIVAYLSTLIKIEYFKCGLSPVNILSVKAFEHLLIFSFFCFFKCYLHFPVFSILF